MLGKKADEKTKELNLPFDDEKLIGISVSKNEQKTTLYLGYTDLSEYRKYQCSHQFLKYYLMRIEYCVMKFFRVNQVFKLLKAHRDDLISKYDDIIDDLRKRYSIEEINELNNEEDKLKRQQLLTGLIYQLMHCQRLFDASAQVALIEGRFIDRRDKKTLSLLTDSPKASAFEPISEKPWGV
jgi:uncharacterized Rmd1/YagE family protein